MEVRGEPSEEMELSACCTASPCERDRDDRVLTLERDLKEQQELTSQMRQTIVALQAKVDALERQVARQNNPPRTGGQSCYPHPVPFSAIPANIPNTIIERRTLEDEGGEPSPTSQMTSENIDDGPCVPSHGTESQIQQEWSAPNRHPDQGQRLARTTPPYTPRRSLPQRPAGGEHKQQFLDGTRSGRPHSSPGKQVYARKPLALDPLDSSRTDERRVREGGSHPGSRDSSVSLPSPSRGRHTRQPTPTESSSRISSRHPTPEATLSQQACEGKSAKSRHPTPTDACAMQIQPAEQIRSVAAVKEKGSLRYNVNGKNVVVYQPTAPVYATYDGPEDVRVAEKRMTNARVQLEYVYGFRGKDTRSALCVNKDGSVVMFAAAVGVVLDPQSNSQRFFFGHDDEIRCIAMHPDGVTVATGQQCGGAGQPMVSVWNSSTCWQRAVLSVRGEEGGKGAVASALAFSPSGRWLAGVYEQSGMCTYHLVLWDWQHGKQLACVPAHSQHPVLCLCFNPDNDGELVTAGKSHLKFWTITEKRGQTDGKAAPQDGAGPGGGSAFSLRSKAGIFGTGTGTSQKPGFISCVAFGRGGNLLCGTSNGQILLWNETSVLQAMAAHDKPVLSLVVCSESGNILSGGADGAIKQWTEFQEPAAPDVQVSGSVRALGFGPDGALFVGTSFCEILRVDMQHGSVQRVLQAHRDTVGGVSCHPEQPCFVSVCADGSLIRFDMQTRRIVNQAKLSASAVCSAFSEDGQLVAIGLADGGVVLVHGESMKELWREEHNRSGGITDVKFSPGGRLLAVAGTDSFVDVFDVKHLAALGESEAVAVRRCGRCRGHCVGVLKVDWSVRGGTAAKGEGAGEEGEERGECAVQAERSKEADESARPATATAAMGGGVLGGGDGKGWYLRSCGKDHGLFFWWVSEGGLPRLLTRGGAECRDAAWATQTCVVGWGVQGVFVDGKQSGDIVAVARSRDGSMLAVGDATRRLLLTGYPCLTRPPAGKTGRGHAGTVQCVDFSGKDERVLTAGGRDMTVMQWKVDRGREGEGREGDGLGASARLGAEEESARKEEGDSVHGDGEGEDEREGWRVDEGDAARGGAQGEMRGMAQAEGDTAAGRRAGEAERGAGRRERWLLEHEGRSDDCEKVQQWGMALEHGVHGSGGAMQAVVSSVAPCQVVAIEDEVQCVDVES